MKNNKDDVIFDTVLSYVNTTTKRLVFCGPPLKTLRLSIKIVAIYFIVAVAGVTGKITYPTS